MDWEFFHSLPLAPMQKKMTQWTITLFLTSVFGSKIIFGQADTVVNRHHYNYSDYYSNGKIKSLGNYSDSLRTGQWLFYQPNGTILAKGKFISGIAKNKWIYNDYNGKRNSYNWNWRKGFKPGTTFELREGKLYIKQNYIFSNGVFRNFENGKYLVGGKF